jgi:hypothetical protein
VHIELLHGPGCPFVGRVRTVLRDMLARTQVSAVVEEREGPYPSPTLLINGHDVTGHTPGPGPSCRLDLPTEEQILSAIGRVEARRGSELATGRATIGVRRSCGDGARLQGPTIGTG